MFDAPAKHGVSSALDGKWAVEESGHEQRCGDVAGGLGLGTASGRVFALLVRAVGGFLAGGGWVCVLGCDGGEDDAEKMAPRWGWSVFLPSVFGQAIRVLSIAHGSGICTAGIGARPVVWRAGCGDCFAMYPRLSDESSSSLNGLG